LQNQALILCFVHDITKLTQNYYRTINLLKIQSNLLYTRNQSVPRCKHFPPQL